MSNVHHLTSKLHWLKLTHHGHTGRLRSHEHTSYLPLVLLLVAVGAVLATFSSGAFAASPGPEAGSVGLSGTMPGEPPREAATITSPTNGQRFSETPVTVSGTCPKGTLVQIFKNDIFAGSMPCTNEGTFSLDVDLLIGENVLIARVYNSLNQPGPDSNAVTVFYDALPPQAGPLTSLNFGAQQLLLKTDAVYRGLFPGKAFNIPIEVLGGTPPYAVEIYWGDSTSKIVPRDNNIPFDVKHTYDKPGTYQITLQGTDAAGRVAFLTVAAIVNGQPTPPPTAAPTDTNGILGQLLLLWPLYTAAAAAVVSFWLGEQREKRILAKRGLLVSPQV